MSKHLVCVALVMALVLGLAGTVMAGPIPYRPYRMEITIDADTHIGTNLTDWTLVFDQSFGSTLTAAGGPLYTSQNGGGDVVFSSDAAGTDRLAVDVRTWDTVSKTCEVAVKVPTVSSSADTKVYMWWGDPVESQPLPGDTYGQYDAYDANSVVRLPDGSGLTRTSYTSINAARTGAILASGAGEKILGQNATFFDGSNDYASDTALGTTFPGDVTVSTWFYLTNDGWEENDSGKGRIVDLAQAADYGLQLTRRNEHQVALDDSGGPVTRVETVGTYYDSAWHMIAATRSGTTYRLYVDGSYVGQATGGTAPTYTRLFLGKREDNQKYYGGYLDEVSVCNTARSADWVRADYHNVKNTTGFLTFSETESLSFGVIPEPAGLGLLGLALLGLRKRRN